MTTLGKVQTYNRLVKCQLKFVILNKDNRKEGNCMLIFLPSSAGCWGGRVSIYKHGGLRSSLSLNFDKSSFGALKGFWSRLIFCFVTSFGLIF